MLARSTVLLILFGPLLASTSSPLIPPNISEGLVAGVVMDFRVVGGAAEVFVPFFNQTKTGRVLTHEVGHFFGLLHTFDSYLDIILGTSCQSSDGIADTPPQYFATQNCALPNTCSEQPDEPDMTENHMNYSSDKCRVAFTDGQIAVMRGVIEKERKGLIGGQVSIKNVPSSARFQLFPNPTTGRFWAAPPADSGVFELFDARGERLFFEKRAVWRRSNLKLKKARRAFFGFDFWMKKGPLGSKKWSRQANGEFSQVEF